MAGLRRRYNKWEAKVRIPKELLSEFGGKDHLYRTLEATDRRTAKVEAEAWEAALRLEWAERRGATISRDHLRNLYERVLRDATAGEFQVYIADNDADPVDEGIGFEIEKIAGAVGYDGHPSPVQATRLAALQDARQRRAGKIVGPRPELEPSFSELAEQFMRGWKAKKGLKESNTEQQKRATFSLFAGYWQDRPIRQVTRPDAARFMDALRHMDPLWARSPGAREMSWSELQSRFGNRPSGLSDGTLNRHAATLKALWEWAADRGYCDGRNPFSGFHTRLRNGVNVSGYVAWEKDELKRLLCPAPKRRDLYEIILVGMFSGMRLDEIASLRWEQLREEEGIAYLQVLDAKTPAGNRQVPVHPSLAWLLGRPRGEPQERIWPTFNPEGPGKKPGADAGREFSRFKTSRGFTDRRKAFHSFRKNVTRQMERAQVPENEWAQVFGHEKGFTYGRYNPDGITLQRKAEIIRLISYPGLPLSEVA